MPCRTGHVVNYTGYCRLCGAWLFDPDGPMSPFHPHEPDDDESCHKVEDD